MTDINKTPRRSSRFRRWLRRLLVGMCVIGFATGLYAWMTYRGPTPPTEIFRGVTYSCERLPDDAQGGGLLFLTKVDLSAPGIEIYVTPMDAQAKADGWEYRLKNVGSVVRDEHLAVAVNGPMFESDSLFIRRSGDMAKSVETVVVDHAANHIYPYCWLLWFDDDGTPHVGEERPPLADEIDRARWGVGSQMRTLMDGKVNSWGGIVPDRRTVLALNPAKHLLWLACFQKASYRYAANIMAEHGATEAINLDGGTSTTMAIGSGAAGVRDGVVTGGWRPVAVQFGIRAQRLNEH